MTAATRGESQVRTECRAVLDGATGPLAPLKGSCVLVAGGTGFVGTWLAEMLACLNDDFNFGTRVILLARTIEQFQSARRHLSGRKDVRLMQADVVFLRELPRDTNWLVNAAATPDNRFHASSPVETMSTIIEGAANLIRSLDPLPNFRQAIHLSSGLVYGGQPLSTPALKEDCQANLSLGSASCAYREAKRCAETQFAAARTQKRLPVVVARPFAFLGPYQSLETPWASNNFLNDAFSQRAIRIHGDGETVRSYLYASDMAYWILRMLTAETAPFALNLGSPQATTLRELAVLVASHFNPPPQVVLQSTVKFSPSRTRSVPDVSLAKESLGLAATVPLAEAVERTVRWHHNLRADMLHCGKIDEC